MKFRAPLSILLTAAVTFMPIANAQSNKGNGNNGNGAGNSSSGNQGNDKPSGNTGSSTTNTGSSSTNNAATGGNNGGNNGNGVGNTGPGNQGNDKPVGNAGGGSTGSSTGGSGTTGNANGGNNGNAGGGATGSSTGGSSTTGNANGGNNGNAGGGATGSSTGGSSTTGNANGGNNGNAGGGATGSSTGGSSTTGNANGGNNGNAGGGATGSSTGGSSNTGNANGGAESTGGHSAGNNGNGVGNSGPGNQGNDKPNGNAGGSTTGGSNGNANGGSNGNANGGSNGNANGGSNGNANGGSNGNANGGSNGNANGGSNGNANGGNNGNANGGNNGNANGGNNGNANGGSTTGGSTTGGTTGETTGGTTSGTTGGSTTGGTTGETTGGTTGETTGGTTGETTGGTTGETTGGTTGETTGGTTGETTGGSTTGETAGGATGGVTEAPEKKIRVKALPLAFGNYDIQKKIINLTVGELQHANADVVLDDFRMGFKVVQFKSYDLGLGIAPQVLVDNATGLLAASTGLVGIAAVKSQSVQYERLVQTEEEAKSLLTLPLPYKKGLLKLYKAGESVQFESAGGLVFSGGAGALGAYVGGSVLAEGKFKTIVTKTSQDKVMVQVSKAKVKKMSLFTGVAVVKLDTSTNNQLNEGFTYAFDLNSVEAVSAYESLLAGNAIPAQELSAKGIYGVTNKESFINTQSQKTKGITVGIPMIFLQKWTAGKTYGLSETQMHEDYSQTNLNYGVYFKEFNGRFFHKHKKLIRSFYSGKAVNKSGLGAINSEDQLASYYWSYEHDSSKSSHFKKALKTMQKDLGLRDNFNPSVALKEKLGYMKLEAQVDIPESYTKKLIESTNDKMFAEVMSKRAIGLISKYFAKGDMDDLCFNDDEEPVQAEKDCKKMLTRQTVKSLGKIKTLLVSMNEATDAAEFTSLHALMGKEFVKNQFVLGSIFALDNNCELSYKLKLEGQRLSQVTKKVPANPACR